MAPVTRNRSVRIKGPARLLQKRAILIRLLVALALFSAGESRAADGSLEYDVKAAFLLNFTKFIEWPESAFEGPGSPMAVCILGNDPFGSTLERMVNGEVVKGRRLTARRMKSTPSPKSCQVLFWTNPQKDLEGLAKSGLGILTVGEGERFLREGGMISFVIQDRRVRFDVNPAAAERAGLKISSKLLAVARSVENQVRDK